MYTIGGNILLPKALSNNDGGRRLEGFDRKPVDFDRIVRLADRAPYSADIHFGNMRQYLAKHDPCTYLDVPVHAHGDRRSSSSSSSRHMRHVLLLLPLSRPFFLAREKKYCGE